MKRESSNVECIFWASAEGIEKKTSFGEPARRPCGEISAYLRLPSIHLFVLPGVFDTQIFDCSINPFFRVHYQASSANFANERFFIFLDLFDFNSHFGCHLWQRMMLNLIMCA